MSRYFEGKTRLARAGRVSLWWEPRDLWIGYYHGPDARYLCLVPCFPFRWEDQRRARDRGYPQIQLPAGYARQRRAAALAAHRQRHGLNGAPDPYRGPDAGRADD